MTGGALAIRGGWKSARNGAIAAGCVLAVFEGVGIAVQRMMAAQNVPVAPQIPDAPLPA